MLSVSYRRNCRCHGAFRHTSRLTRSQLKAAVLLCFWVLRCASCLPDLEFTRPASAPVAPSRPRPFVFLSLSVSSPGGIGYAAHGGTHRMEYVAVVCLCSISTAVGCLRTGRAMLSQRASAVGGCRSACRFAQRARGRDGADHCRFLPDGEVALNSSCHDGRLVFSGPNELARPACGCSAPF